MKTHLLRLFTLVPLVSIALFGTSPPLKGAPEAPATPQRTPEEVRKDTDELMVRLAAHMTPEMQRVVVDSIMKVHGPRYRALFDSWKLDPAIADQALDIIRQRHTNIEEQSAQFLKKGVAGVSENVHAMKAESEKAQARLLPLLGQERLDELTKLEAQMTADALARAQETRKAAASPAPAVPPASKKAGQSAEEILKKAGETRESLNAKLISAAARVTPEMKRATVDAIMRSREPGYRTLFDSWKLDPATSDRVLAIIREKETKVAEQRYHFMQKGVAGISEGQEAMNTEREKAKAQLLILLGPDRVDEFTRKEAEMTADLIKNKDTLQAKAEEARKASDAAFAKLSKKTPPEMQRALTQVAVLGREPRYRELFQSWNLDADTSAMALAIIRLRETQLVEQRIPFFEKGLAGSADYQQGTKTARQNAEAQLRSLLGAVRFYELIQTEEKMAAESKARVEELMRNRPKS